MLDASSRLLRLLSLLTSRRSWSGPDLAQRLEVTERTLRRDIDKLRGLGYPVRSTSGIAGGYQLGAGQSLPPLMLDTDEALAVAVGLRSAATYAVSGAAEAAVRALSKLDQVLPNTMRRKVRALDSSVSPLHFSGAPVDPDALMALADACREECTVRFHYQDRSGRESSRTVEPHGIVSSGARWYLVAWDIDREDFRSFRVDRLAKVKPDTRRFSRRKIPQGSAAAYVSKSVAVAGYDLKARVILHAPYEDMARRIPPLTGTLEPLDESRCLLEVGTRSAAHLGLNLAMLDCEFEVLEPPELIAELRKLSKRLARAASVRK